MIWKWLPRIGWIDLSAEECAEFELEVRWNWQAFSVGWHNHGFLLMIRPTSLREEFDK